MLIRTIIHSLYSRLIHSAAVTGVAAVVITTAAPGVLAATAVSGRVVDLNGRPLPQVQLVFNRSPERIGAAAVSVFSGPDGYYSFPQSFPEDDIAAAQFAARSLQYSLLDVSEKRTASGLELTFIMKNMSNQAGTAPASAWLARLKDRHAQSQFVMDCIDCHQVPASEQRDYAAAIADLHAPDPAAARLQSWNSIVKYMNYLSAWEFSRGSRDEDQKIDADAVYGVENGEHTAATLAAMFDDRLDRISGYDWGAPLITGPGTHIWEYELPGPNAVREALLLGNPASLWVADVSANRMFEVDIASGRTSSHEVPSDLLMSPHSLHREADGALWITPLFNSIVARLDPASGEWQTWKLRTDDGKSPGIHDLSFGWEHTLLKDDKGRIWFSDIGNNAVGYFDPVEGNSQIWPAPASPGRDMAPALYGLSMTSNRKEVWYSQLGNGTFGGFDIEKQQYIGPFQFDDPNAGPRRISVDNNDVLYLALYGSGQLAEFDTRTRRMIGVYDLPDTASAPYATTWDPVRKVIWIATSNGDVIYRFDPSDKSFGVLPLPRERAFLRMIDIDPRTGVLVTSYANIVDIVQGPRMALIIDPGDGAYPETFSPQTSQLTAGAKP